MFESLVSKEDGTVTAYSNEPVKVSKSVIENDVVSDTKETKQRAGEQSAKER